LEHYKQLFFCCLSGGLLYARVSGFSYRLEQRIGYLVFSDI